MSLETLLDHKCNIYHIVETQTSPGYGLATSASFSYPENPDLQQVPCHFAVRSADAGATLIQHEPQNDLTWRTKLVLPLGTDIRRNDKVVSLDTGLEYTAEQPRNIRNHHLFVYVQRLKEQKPL
ncbi:MAG: YqbH/XkdH family protein [Oscillospiraceae bacterium]|jgi:hypothetical protein|nr:YqbH/XkdH family protein [Oscillospiraceae bacterium]